MKKIKTSYFQLSIELSHRSNTWRPSSVKIKKLVFPSLQDLSAYSTGFIISIRWNHSYRLFHARHPPPGFAQWCTHASVLRWCLAKSMSTALQWGCPGLTFQILFNINLSGTWVVGALCLFLWEKNLIESKFRIGSCLVFAAWLPPPLRACRLWRTWTRPTIYFSKGTAILRV